MSRILLVDDEPLITRTLHTLILDEMPDVEVYGVNSALQAMEMLKRNVYDIVVTDVSMPRVSGLELLDHIKKLCPICYVIVLTAYDSFDYAYKTLQYEDVRFILKIEPPQMILDAIRGGLDKVRQYFSVTQDNQRIRQYLKDALPLLRQTLLERLLRFGEDLPDRAICESSGIGIVPGQDTLLAVTGPMKPQEKRQEICFLALSMLRDRGLMAEVWYSESSLVFLIQSEDGADMPSVILGQLDRLIEGADSAIGLSFAVSSRPVPWARVAEAVSVLESYAHHALESNRIVLRDPLAERKRSITFGDAFRWRRDMEQRNLSGLMDSIRSCVLLEGYPQGRNGCALLLQMHLRERFQADCLDGVKVDGYTAESVLFHGSFDSLEEWMAKVRTLLETLFMGSRARRLTETDDMLDRINRYIQEHFPQQISLTQIAEHFNYNSSYLSRIYKQNMREGLSEHIVRTRIEAACQMLQGSNRSINEIAEGCGFQSTKYFITVFKRVKGMTPKGWREMR
ncbi:MAG: response regulator [Clostridiales bacterium]|nr:response regulator [Clostridiales bacterium]